MMTEKEALRKWCPFSRVAIGSDLTANRSYTDGEVSKALPGSLCLASECMLWRWEANEAPHALGSCGAGANAMVVVAGRP